MWMVGYAKLAAVAKPVAITACLLLAAACAENKSADQLASAETETSTPPGSQQDFLLNVGDRVFFNENSTELSPTATASLDKQAVWLAKFTAYSFTLEGHSDEKGGNAKNKQLSEKRVQAVKNYLVTHGVDPSRIRVVSYGREKRAAHCNDVSCWSQNRRVVTVLQTVADPLMASRPQPGRLPVIAAPRT